MEYYRLYLDYESCIDFEWNYTTFSLQPSIKNQKFINDFYNATNLTPKQSKNGMYFFVDCSEEQAIYIKMKYSDIITEEKTIDIDIGKIDVNK